MSNFQQQPPPNYYYPEQGQPSTAHQQGYFQPQASHEQTQSGYYQQQQHQGYQQGYQQQYQMQPQRGKTEPYNAGSSATLGADGTPAQTGSPKIVSKPKYNDVWATLLFVLVFLSFAGLAIAGETL